MAGSYRLDPAVREGQPADARISIPINFTLPRRAPPPSINRDASRLAPR
jgi:hypothetical protein